MPWKANGSRKDCLLNGTANTDINIHGRVCDPFFLPSRKGSQVEQLLERRREMWRLKEQDPFRKHLWEREDDQVSYRADMQKAGQG